MISNQKRTRLQGFTLWEVLLVLSIVSGLVIFPNLLLRRWQQYVHVTQFLATFEKQLAYTQQSAITLEQNMEVLLSQEQQKFSFADFGSSGKKFQEVVVPDDLQVQGPAKIIFLRKTGNNGYLGKYTFSYPKKQQKIIYQFQLGSGKYVKKVAPL
ncbi:competence type IV pilus minor pilin ComGD [Enterococcus faecalis]